MNGGQSMSKAIGSRHSAAFAVLFMGLAAWGAGCGALSLRLEGTDFDRAMSAETSASYFGTKACNFSLLAKFDAPPEILEIITLGGIKDARKPDVYVRLAVPQGRHHTKSATVILMAPWEGGALWQGVSEVSLLRTSADVVEIEASGTLPLGSGMAAGPVSFRLAGRFLRDEAAWQRLAHEFDSEILRIRNLCSPGPASGAKQERVIALKENGNIHH